MDPHAFLDTVRERAGRINPAELGRVARMTLRALGSQAPDDVADLGRVLPGELRTVLEAGHRGPPVELTDLFAELARTTRMRTGIALELVETVVAVLAERLDAPTRDHLRRHLPVDWAALIVDPRPPSLRRPPHPRGGQTHSIAANPDPHADTRLASTPGPSAERHGETLAEGRPGSQRPLATAGDANGD
jgi:uncharacterized protein (DUF2267 family)